MRLLSWNVNGIRAAERKGFLAWLETEQPDALCVQEIKARPEQLSEALLAPAGYDVTWFPAERAGYSGVATFTKRPPQRSTLGFGEPRFDREGRVIQSDFEDFSLFNVYFPNGGQGPERVRYKLEFYEALLAHCQGLREAGRGVIICGDYNTAHAAIDLARPKANQKTSGFLPEERAWFDRYLEAGYVDCFRTLCEEPDWYSWWSFRSGARARNVGWRIDYHLISEDLRPRLTDAFILRDVPGSDHCPVGIVLDDAPPG